MSRSNMIDTAYGYTKLIPTIAFDDQDRTWLGGYAIHYDLEGNEISRTENRWDCVISGVDYVPCGYEVLPPIVTGYSTTYKSSQPAGIQRPRRWRVLRSIYTTLASYLKPRSPR